MKIESLLLRIGLQYVCTRSPGSITRNLHWVRNGKKKFHCFRGYPRLRGGLVKRQRPFLFATGCDPCSARRSCRMGEKGPIRPCRFVFHPAWHLQGLAQRSPHQPQPAIVDISHLPLCRPAPQLARAM